MRRALFAVAFAGLLVSGYLFIAYSSNAPVLCVEGGGCDAVRLSKYSHLFGLPVPLYGMAYYCVLAVGALLSTDENRKQLRSPLMFLTGLALIYSVWLTYLEAFVIQAWCMWCVVSALLVIVAFILVWFKMPKHGDVN
ncbi:MAG: vitamin K epoxide reductase family protein [Candidatus Andersenbacteria bacterium]|nr:vitamin K epoxide reductase family protein [bacterium]MDZ4225402.1 vitamin K epoxide reductase family protein [Candidatus Andersenbacteria bacterium]